jgi:flagellar P-ring protein precursor FlgI
MKKQTKYIPLLMFFLLIAVQELFSTRIKDIAYIEGVTGVQTIGYGLVSGLNQTGDNQQASYTVQSVSNMLKRFGITVPDRNPRTRNVAAVMVTATIPTFSKKGSKIDVQVSSIGDASSLLGGVLLLTPISTADGVIIGMGQGPLTVGGYDVSSQGSRLSKNSTTTGRVPNGLILEKDIDPDTSIVKNQQIRISLRQPDFTTANRIAEAVNGSAGLANSASALDAGTIQIQLPAGLNPGQITQKIAQIEVLNVISDPVAKVVINERTGTVVIGGSVELLPAVVAHAGLEISIQKQVVVPQPAPFTIRPPNNAETANITANEEKRESVALVVQGPTVKDIAKALNLLGVSPRDLISIFQALKESGSLQGELVIQ